MHGTTIKKLSALLWILHHS